MTKRETIQYFLNSFSPFNDYWEMQLSWTVMIDNLIKDKEVNPKRSTNWGNPCTVEGFKRFNRKFKG